MLQPASYHEHMRCHLVLKLLLAEHAPLGTIGIQRGHVVITVCAIDLSKWTHLQERSAITMSHCAYMVTR